MLGGTGVTDGKPRFRQAGDTALTIDLGGQAGLQQSRRVLELESRIAALSEPGIVETVPALASLTVHYDPKLTSAARLIERLAEALAEQRAPQPGSRPDLACLAAAAPSNFDEFDADAEEQDLQPANRTWLIPACYDPPCGPDVTEVAGRCGLTPWQVTALHACVSYRVLMIGFLPGFPYVGDLPPPLRLPRRTSPRSRVPAGSIAIATTMSVIYPHESPGGWHIIARTPLRLFDASRKEPSMLAPGDEVRFTPITGRDFETMTAKVENGWTIEPTQCET